MIMTTPTSCIIQVLAVEEEMREFLEEMAAEKRKMETKLQKTITSISRTTRMTEIEYLLFDIKFYWPHP